MKGESFVVAELQQTPKRLHCGRRRELRWVSHIGAKKDQLLNHNSIRHRSSVGAPMTPILFRQGARGRPGRLLITAATTVARLSTGHSRADRAALSEQEVQAGNITPPELCAGGFVDFLLGRGARHPR
jgi:hypothetical protein